MLKIIILYLYFFYFFYFFYWGQDPLLADKEDEHLDEEEKKEADIEYELECRNTNNGIVNSVPTSAISSIVTSSILPEPKVP